MWASNYGQLTKGAIFLFYSCFLISKKYFKTYNIMDFSCKHHSMLVSSLMFSLSKMANTVIIGCNWILICNIYTIRKFINHSLKKHIIWACYEVHHLQHIVSWLTLLFLKTSSADHIEFRLLLLPSEMGGIIHIHN